MVFSSWSRKLEITVVLGILAALIAVLQGQSTDHQQEDAVIKKLASQLQHVQPLSPKESMKQMVVHPEFRLELVASEPLIRDPVAMAFDENGQLYVVELPQYNGYAVADFKQKGSIRLLQDTDHDGLMDRSTVFIDDLDYPTALACWDGGLFVGAAPNLFFFKDTNGDGTADLRKVVLDGFGKDHAGEAQLNSFRWGLDLRFHLSTSLAGGDIGEQGAISDKRISVRGRGIIFDPRKPSQFQLTSGGGQHGMSMDDWGYKFVCSNSVPAQALMYDDRYLKNNPFVRAPNPAISLAPEGKFTKLYRISPDEPWRVLRTRLRRQGRFRGSDEGGAPFGFFTGATGITVYRGNGWPQRYRGNLFVGDVANNLVFRARADTDSLEHKIQRMDHQSEFLASRDIWFRPVQFSNGPDGMLYVMDMYRGLIEGAAFLPAEFLSFVNPVGGNNRGRIYRIVPRDSTHSDFPRLGDLSSLELVSLLDHPNGWHRDTASRLLYSRQDHDVIKPLKKRALESVLPVGRITALYALQGMRELDMSLVQKALSDLHPEVRVHALRLAETFSERQALERCLERLASDPSPRVRFQLALSLGAFRPDVKHPILLQMIDAERHLPWMRFALLCSIHESGADVFKSLVNNSSLLHSESGKSFLLDLIQQMGRQGQQRQVDIIWHTVMELLDEPIRETMLLSLLDAVSAQSRKAMVKESSGQLNAFVNRVVREAVSRSRDKTLSDSQRIEAIDRLRFGSFEKAKELFVELLHISESKPIQLVALKTLGRFEDITVAAMIITALKQLSPDVRNQAMETMLSRPSWVKQFLTAVENGEMTTNSLGPGRIQLLEQHPDPDVAEKVRELFSRGSSLKKPEVIQRYRESLSLRGSPDKGKQVFRTACSKCHQLEGKGEALGADLKSIRNRGLESVLVNILDPNREVKPAFLSYVLTLADGRVLSGLLQTETANTLVLRLPDGMPVTVQRTNVESLFSTGLSYMPEGLEKQLDIKAMADLLSYLDSLP